MRAIAEFRVTEEFARRLFGDDEGQKIGSSVRKIELPVEDPRFPQIGKLQKELHRTINRSFFHGWNIRYIYTEQELADAALFILNVSSTFEPAGEECGTQYNELTACPRCGSGATQVSSLRLDLRRVPKSADIARTIAGEVIVSQRLAERLLDGEFTGFDLGRILHKARYEDDQIDLHQLPIGRDILRRAEIANAPHPTGRFWVWLNRVPNVALLDQARAEFAELKRKKIWNGGIAPPVWHQLIVNSKLLEIAPDTRVGVDPYDDDIGCTSKCPMGDLLGLNLLSEVVISDEDSAIECDIVQSRQFIGTRRGLLRPRQVIMVSQKFRALIKSAGINGAYLDIAHIV